MNRTQMNRSYLFLAGIVALVFGGCLPASRIGRSSGGTTQAHEVLQRSYASPSVDYTRRTVLVEAERWLGTPYSFGGDSRSGVDCSAFVCNVFETIHLQLPRNSAAQAESGEGIDRNSVLPGDLVFFNTTGSGVSHVGIMINPDQFIHASTSMGVMVSSLNEPYYHDRMLFIRRVIN